MGQCCACSGDPPVRSDVVAELPGKATRDLFPGVGSLPLTLEPLGEPAAEQDSHNPGRSEPDRGEDPGSPGHRELDGVEGAGKHQGEALVLPIAQPHLPADPGHGGAEGLSDLSLQAQALLSALRSREAAALLERAPESDAAGMRAALRLQLQALGQALERLAHHPGLSEVIEDSAGEIPEELLGVRVAASPKSARSISTVRSERPDLVEVGFDLDSHGHRVEAVVEFFPDGTAAIQWTALDLPIPLPYVMCMVHEVDLLGELVPYVQSACVVHQFPWNAADRLVRIVSKPPIPFVKGFEAVAQRFGFDLLDTPWAGLCLVETGPIWAASSPPPPPPGNKAQGGAQWRGVTKPAPSQPGFKQVDVKTVVALGRPSGARGECTTILFSGKGDLGVPRSMLPDMLVTWLVKLIGKFIFQKALSHIAGFHQSKHGERLRGPDSAFYQALGKRIEKCTEARAKATREE